MEIVKDQVTEQIKLVARYRKAKKIALLLIAMGGNVESVKQLGASEMGRTLAANAAKTHVPSDITWALVVALVEEVTA